MPTLSPKTTPYYGGGQVVNPANVITTTGSPSANLIQEGLGTLAVDNAASTIYALVSKSGGTATWVSLGGGSSQVSSLSGDSGTATPTAGDIKIAGTASQIVTTGGGSTVTCAFATPNFTLSTNKALLQNAGTGTNVSIQAVNTDPAASSTAILAAGSQGSQAYSLYENTLSTASWSIGNDPGSSDSLVVAPASNLNTPLITVTPTGSLNLTNSNSGSAVNLIVSNTSNTASSTAYMEMSVAGTTASNPYLLWDVAGTADWSMGIDNADTQALVLSRSATLGTNNVMRVDNATGFVEFPLTVTFDSKVNIFAGANGSAGTATLGAGGTVVVATTSVTASSLIYLTVNTPAGTQGFLSAPTASIIDGTSFVINSSDAGDTSTVNWLIIN